MNKNILRKGRFIVIEGADGVGSSTQCHLLVEKLKASGRSAALTAEPSTGRIGVMAREMLRSDSGTSQDIFTLLFAADRIDHYRTVIAPQLDSGIDIVCDRYLLSTYVYQSLEMPLDWIETLNVFAPMADITLLISLPFEASWSRIQARIESLAAKEEIFDKKELQQRIHASYANLLDKVKGISVDGRGDPAEVSGRVMKALLSADGS